jgi:hypothetical protein
MKSIILIAVVICLGCSISGCGGYTPPNNPQTAASMAGSWQFTYTSSKSSSMSLSGTGTLTQTGNSFSGTLSTTGACSISGTISGTLSGLSLTGTLTGTNLTISVTGTVVSSYNSASGSYQVMMATGACAAVSGDSGTWTGTRSIGSGVGGYFIGPMQAADRLPMRLALNLKGDGGQLSGTATFTNSACLHSMNVAGTLSGMNLELKGDGGTDGSIVLRGTSDKEGKTLTLNSMVSGTCQAESGAGTLTKVQ